MSVSVGHVGLSVTDLDVSSQFYQEILGFKVALEAHK